MAGGMIHLVRIIETRPPGVTHRRWRDVRTTVMRTMGLHWHKNILPRHFEPNAERVYHYRQRTSKYLKEKAWRLARGQGITQKDVIAEMERTIPRRAQNQRGFGEDWFWHEFQTTREKMLVRAGKGDNLAALTFSGNLRRNVTQAATVRAFEQRFKIVMPGTRYTPDRPRTTKQPPIAQEVTSLLEYEKAEMSKLGKATAVRELQAIRSPTTTNIT